MFVPKVRLKRKKCYCYGDEDVSFNSSSLFNLLLDKSFFFSRKDTLLSSMLCLFHHCSNRKTIKDLSVEKYF